MQNKTFRFGPIALTAALTTNLLNPPTAAGGVNAGTSPQVIVLKHLRIMNKSGAAVSFSMWLGGTGANAAGTEVIGSGQQVPANSSFDWYLLTRSDHFGTGGICTSPTQPHGEADGGASVATALSIMGEGEIGVAG
jgi:hypothetical protein